MNVVAAEGEEEKGEEKDESGKGTPTGQGAVGWAVEVYWPMEEEWFSGEIVMFDSSRAQYKIHYDDGDVDWEDITSTLIKFKSFIGINDEEENKAEHEAKEDGNDTGVLVTAAPVVLEPPWSSGESEVGGDSETECEEQRRVNSSTNGHNNDKRPNCSSSGSRVSNRPSMSVFAREPSESKEELKAKKDVVEEKEEQRVVENPIEKYLLSSKELQKLADKHKEMEEIYMDGKQIGSGVSQNSQDSRCRTQADIAGSAKKSIEKETREIICSDDSDDQDIGVSRAEFLTKLRIYTDKIRDNYLSMAHSFRRPGPGRGTLQGSIFSITNLPPKESNGGAYNSIVKISYVEPGKQSIMMRCKTVLYTSAMISESLNPVWKNDFFQVEIDGGESWCNVKGDLLFAVYDSQEGTGNEFIGQIIFPIRDLVDLKYPEAHDGPQFKHEVTRSLETRQGRRLHSQLSLSMQLILPEGSEEVDFFPESFEKDEATASKVNQGNVSQLWQPSTTPSQDRPNRWLAKAESKAILPNSRSISPLPESKYTHTRVTNDAKWQKGSKTSQPRSCTAVRARVISSTDSLTDAVRSKNLKARAEVRRLREEALTHENARMAQKIKSLAPTKAAAPRNQQEQLEQENKRMKKERRLIASREAAFQADCRGQLALRQTVSELQKDISSLREDVLQWKAKVSNLQGTIQKYHSTLTQLKRRASTVLPGISQRKYIDIAAANQLGVDENVHAKKKEGTVSDVSLNGGPCLLEEKLALLEVEHEDLMNKKQASLLILSTMRQKDADLSEKINQMNKQIVEIKAREAYCEEKAEHEGKTCKRSSVAMDTARGSEYALYKNAQQELRELRIEIDTLHQSMKSQEEIDISMGHNLGHLHSITSKETQRVKENLQSKIERKKSKILATQLEASAFTTKYHELMEKNVAPFYRQQIQDYHYAISLCEKERN